MDPKRQWDDGLTAQEQSQTARPAKKDFMFIARSPPPPEFLSTLPENSFTNLVSQTTKVPISPLQ